MPVSRVHHRFSVEDYDEMIARGILGENDRVELIRGEIVDKMTTGDPHIGCVNRLNTLLNALANGRWLVSIQNAIRVADSKPEPDVALLRYRADFYSTSTATVGDILLLIEVADTSLDFDREVKLSLYAEAGVAEYWIVNLIDSCVEVHRGPRSDGSYADSHTVAKGGTVSFQGTDLHVDQLF